VAESTLGISDALDIEPGDVLRYPWWYRDPAGSPCGTGFNLSNGLAVRWMW
jgi:hypothetical protein